MEDVIIKPVSMFTLLVVQQFKRASLTYYIKNGTVNINN